MHNVCTGMEWVEWMEGGLNVDMGGQWMGNRIENGWNLPMEGKCVEHG